MVTLSGGGEAAVCVGKQYAQNVGRNILIPVTVRAVRIFPSKEQHRRVVVTLMQSLLRVFPILFQRTVMFVVAVH